ncbi:DUF6248 family natural product biosynthesis protein [Streptomyces cyaneofuscatus]|uniref:DUF6248 family natural product biosynthesis protein n=1 Tax=Streptomyces cyaneofuscatus TaxID=66883 RepID=UPI00366441F7
MTPQQAEWVRTRALPRHVLAGTSLFLLTHCDCQFGQCAHCAFDRHDQCAFRRETTRSEQGQAPETYLIGRSDGSALAEVFLAATACRWRCACTCRQQPAAERGLLFDI